MQSPIFNCQRLFYHLLIQMLARSVDTGKLGIHVSAYKLKFKIRGKYVTIYYVVIMNHKGKISSQILCLLFIFSWKFRKMLYGYIQIKDLIIIGISCSCSILTNTVNLTPPFHYILFLTHIILQLE